MKEKKLTESLSFELSRIDAALTIMTSMNSLEAIETAKEGCKNAFELLLEIKVHLNKL